MGKIAWVTGATGLVGQQLMNQLSADERYSKVIAFVRKHSTQTWSGEGKVSQIVIDFDQLPTPELKEALGPVDDLFCALGTTKKQTPDPAQFHKIDVSYPNAFAEFGQHHGARFCGVVSAHGAKHSSPFPYLKMKGEMEKQIESKRFGLTAFARPGLLKGDRPDFRLLEKATECITDFMPGNYRSIHVRDVAAALIRAANPSEEQKNNDASAPIQILESKAMQGCYQP